MALSTPPRSRARAPPSIHYMHGGSWTRKLTPPIGRALGVSAHSILLRVVSFVRRELTLHAPLLFPRGSLDLVLSRLGSMKAIYGLCASRSQRPAHARLLLRPSILAPCSERKPCYSSTDAYTPRLKLYPRRQSRAPRPASDGHKSFAAAAAARPPPPRPAAPIPT